MKKNSALWIALAGTLSATAWVAVNDKSEQEVLIPKTRKAVVADTTGTAGIANPEVRVRLSSKVEAADSVGLAGWQRTPITREPLPLFSADSTGLAYPHKNQPTSPPEMPSLPFIYAGKLIDGGSYTVFLLAGERNLAVHKGDVVDEVWRVKDIRPPRMIIKYLPLKLEAVMDIGESK